MVLHRARAAVSPNHPHHVTVGGQAAPFTYDAVMVIVDAMKRANSAEPAAILAEMPKTNYKGVIGNIAFDEKGDMKEGTITLYEYKDKKKSVLDVVKM